MARMPNGRRQSAPASISAIEDVVLVFDRVVQLPAELADEVDAQRLGRRQPDAISWPVSQGKAALEKSASRGPLQQLARPGPGDHQHAHRVGQVVELDRAVVRHVLMSQSWSSRWPGAGRDQVEASPASRMMVYSECTPPRLLSAWQGSSGRSSSGCGWRPGGRGTPRRPAPRPRLGEGGHVEQADVLAHVACIRRRPCSNQLRAAERPVVSCGSRPGREPVRPLPAELLAEHSAQRLHAGRSRAASAAAAPAGRSSSG